MDITQQLSILFRKIRLALGGYILQPWSSIRRFGESRLLRSSFVWIAIVPVAAMAFSEMDRIMIPMFGDSFSLKLQLPFSWFLFYFAACSFAIASGIYSLFCPSIIREFRSFADFSAEGRNSRYLYEEFIRALAFQDKREHPGFGDKKFEELLGMDYEDLQIIRFNHEFLEPPPSTKPEDPNESNVFLDSLNENAWQAFARELLTSPIRFKPDKNRDAFWHVRNLSESTFKVCRCSCVILYSIGFALLFFVLFQNFCFVVST